MKTLFDRHINVVGTALDLQLQRQNVINSNIANIKTEGYKPRVLEFEEKLQSALGLDGKGKLSLTHERHMPSEFNADSFTGEFSKEFKPRIVHGEDRVNIDKEMASMAKTQLHYSALASVIRSNFEGLRNIITEGQK